MSWQDANVASKFSEKYDILTDKKFVRVNSTPEALMPKRYGKKCTKK